MGGGNIGDSLRGGISVESFSCPTQARICYVELGFRQCSADRFDSGGGNADVSEGVKMMVVVVVMMVVAVMVVVVKVSKYNRTFLKAPQHGVDR